MIGLYIFLVLIWMCWVTLALASALQVRKFSRRINRHVDGLQTFRPPATIIVPYKGIDRDLIAGLHSLCHQNYPGYRLFVVVESESDPAFPILTSELQKYPTLPSRVLVAGVSGPRVGQKVHNLLSVLDLIWDDAADDEVWVFADSDAIPGPHWLENLVEPLSVTEKNGVTTGYRWMMPEAPANAWTHMASVINSSAACLYASRDEFNHAWGGAMAVRADTARKGGLRDRLRGAISDDYQMTRMVKDMGLRVCFVPSCLILSSTQFTFASMLNFAYRQYLITRIYTPWLYMSVMGIMNVLVLAMYSAWGVLIWSLATAHFAYAILPAMAIVTVLILNQIRANARVAVVRARFGEETVRALATTLWYDRWATPAWITLHWFLISLAAFGNTMTWRGVRYRINGPQKVERL